MLPEVFGDFLLVRRFDGDSMAEVFVAVRLGDRAGRLFVVKRPPLGDRGSSAASEALRREAEVLRVVRGPGLPVLEASGDIAGLPFVALEHVRGASLERVLAAGPLDVAAARALGKQLARSLATLHEAGWVHGDVAPSNVVIDEAGDVFLLDFGISDRIGAQRTSPAGKPGYVAPEVAARKVVSAADDVYAWGVVIAESAIGRRLFDERDLAEAAARSGPPQSVEREGLEHAKAALAHDPGSRPTAPALVEALAGEDAGGELGRRASEALRAAIDGHGSPADQSSDAPRAAVTAATTAPVARPGLDTHGRAASASPSRGVVAALVAALVVACVLGFVAGRRTPHAKGAKLTLPMLPARTEVQLDGRALLVPEPGRAMPIEPGRHTLSVEIGKREVREYEFVAEPGDHVVVVSVSAGRRIDKAGDGKDKDKDKPKAKGGRDKGGADE